MEKQYKHCKRIINIQNRTRHIFIKRYALAKLGKTLKSDLLRNANLGRNKKISITKSFLIVKIPVNNAW